jgi:hypothetical protein
MSSSSPSYSAVDVSKDNDPRIVIRSIHQYLFVGSASILICVSVILGIWLPHVYILYPNADRAMVEEITNDGLHPLSAPIFSILLLSYFSSTSSNGSFFYAVTQKQAEEEIQRLIEKSRLLTDEKHREIVETWLKYTFSLSFSNVTFLYYHSEALLAPYELDYNKTPSFDYELKRDLLQEMKKMTMDFDFVPYYIYSLGVLQNVLKNNDVKTVKTYLSLSKNQKDIVSFIAWEYLHYCDIRQQMDNSTTTPMIIFTAIFGFIMICISGVSFALAVDEYIQKRRRERQQQAQLNRNGAINDDSDDVQSPYLANDPELINKQHSTGIVCIAEKRDAGAEDAENIHT